MNTVPHHSEDLDVELWVLFGFGLFVIGCRMTARRMHLGSFKKFQIDDYIMLFVIFTFTGVFVTSYEVSKNGSNYTHLGHAETEVLTKDEISRAVWGSKMTFVLEEFLIITIWLIKACILLLYGRLTLGLWQHRAIKLLAWYCALGFVVVEILLFGVWCRPFTEYWAVPPSNTQCATYYQHMIVASVFNLSSDICIFAIPLPILMNSMMPLRRKIVLSIVFSLGIFVIMAAVLNKYYNFSQKFSLIFLNWYVGEVSTAVFVANLPLCWPLVRWVFRLDTWGNNMGMPTTRHTTTQSPNLQRTALFVATKPLSIGPITVVSTFGISHGPGEGMDQRVEVPDDDDDDELEITTLPGDFINIERRVEAELGLKRGSVCAVHSPFSKFPSNRPQSSHWPSPRRDLPARQWYLRP